MRILFGVLGLLIVVSIVLNVARKQLQAVGSVTSSAPAAATADPTAPAGARAGRLDAFPGAAAADSTGLTVPQQSQSLQNRVANDVNRALQSAPSRAEGQ
jgi:hypothetical protein